MIVDLIPVLYSLVSSTFQHTDQSLLTISPWHYATRQSYDLSSDSSLLKYLWPSVALDNPHYAPSDLLTLQTSDYLKLNEPSMKLRSEAALALENLAQDLYNQTWSPLSIVSAYRSFSQQAMINKVYGADTLRALAWHSEHQLGLAVDVLWLTNSSIQNNSQFRSIYLWMVANAYRYWFTQSYQKWVAVDGYEREDWHRRYVGSDLAKQLLDAWITFTEYYQQQRFRP